jgi:hypothetical protein
MTDDKSREAFDQHAIEAGLHYGFRWPQELTSGVMFWKGSRITLADFNQAALRYRDEHHKCECLYMCKFCRERRDEQEKQA